MNYYSYDEMLSDARALQRKYTGLVECETIGYSVCGRRIIMLRIGCGTKTAFISAGIHGRESINTPVLMKLAEFYAKKYSSEEYKDKNGGLFSCYCFNIVPLVNPDGYMEAVTDYLKRDNKYNSNGIDINRNFPSALWRPGRTCGCMPGSEPETKALISAFKSHPSFIYIDIHSRGECIYYYRKAMDEAYNRKQYEIALRLCKITGYRLMPPETEISDNDSGGNSVHYYSEQFHMPAITIETLPDEEQFPLNIRLADKVSGQLKNLFELFP